MLFTRPIHPYLTPFKAFCVLSLGVLLGCGGGGGGKKVGIKPLGTTPAANLPGNTQNPGQTTDDTVTPVPVGDIVEDPVFGRVVSGQILVELPLSYRNARESGRMARELGLESIASFPDAGLEVLGDKTETLPSNILKKLNRPDLKVGPNLVLKMSSTFQDPALDSPSGSDRWALEKTGAWPLLKNADLGDKGQTIALLDTGVQANHPELAGQVIQGGNLLDQGSSLEDPNGHGTALAGLIAGKAGNGLGAAGICPGCKIKSIRVCNAQGECPASAVLGGLASLVGSDIRVANLSMNVKPKDPNTKELFQNLTSLLKTQGVLVVASAGNDGTDADGILPNGVTGVLTVGATGTTDQPTSISNLGSLVGLFAPGDAIYGPEKSGGFSYISGTSAASALVAGAAGLMLGERPALSLDRLTQAISTTGAPVAGQQAKRLDLAAARLSVADINIAPQVTVQITGIEMVEGKERVAFTVSVSDADKDAVSTKVTSGIEGQANPTVQTFQTQQGQEGASYPVFLTAPETGVIYVSAEVKDSKGDVATSTEKKSYAVVDSTELVLESTATTIPVGGTAQLIVRVKDAEGALTEVTNQAVFELTPVGIAVMPGDPGRLMGLKVGVVQVKVTYGGKSKTLELTVAPAGSLDDFKVSAGDTATFTAPTSTHEYLRDSINANDFTNAAVNRASITAPLVPRQIRDLGQGELVPAPMLGFAGSLHVGTQTGTADIYQLNTASTTFANVNAGRSNGGNIPGANILYIGGKLFVGYPLAAGRGRIITAATNAFAAVSQFPSNTGVVNTNVTGVNSSAGATMGGSDIIFYGTGNLGAIQYAGAYNSTTDTHLWKCLMSGRVFSVPTLYYDSTSGENVMIVGGGTGNNKFILALDTDGSADGDSNSGTESAQANAIETVGGANPSVNCDVVWAYNLGQDVTPLVGGEQNPGSMGSQAIIVNNTVFTGLVAKEASARGHFIGIPANPNPALLTAYATYGDTFPNSTYHKTGLDGCMFSTPVYANVGGKDMMYVGTGTSPTFNTAFCTNDVGRSIYGFDLSQASGAPAVWQFSNSYTTAVSTNDFAGLGDPATRDAYNYFHAPLKFTAGTTIPGSATETGGLVWGHSVNNLLALDPDPSDNVDHGVNDANGTTADVVWRFASDALENIGVSTMGFTAGKVYASLASKIYGFGSPPKPPVVTTVTTDCSLNNATISWNVPTTNLDGTTFAASGAGGGLGGYNIYRASGATKAAALAAGFTLYQAAVNSAATGFTEPGPLAANLVYLYVVVPYDNSPQANESLFYAYNENHEYGTDPDRNQFRSRLYRDSAGDIFFDENALTWSDSTDNGGEFGSMDDGEFIIQADCQRPEKPAAFTAELSCPNLSFSWISPDQDDTNNDGNGDAAMSGLVGYNIYSDSGAIGNVNPYTDLILSTLTPINGASPAGLIAHVGLTSSAIAQTYAINPRFNNATVFNYAITAHDNADAGNDQNESFSSVSDATAYTCQPTVNLSSSFNVDNCGTNNPIYLAWDDVDDDGQYRIYRKINDATPPVTGVDVPLTTTNNIGGPGNLISMDINYAGTDNDQEYYWVTSWDGGTEETYPVLLTGSPLEPDCGPPDAPVITATDIANDEGVGGFPSAVITLTWNLVDQDAASGSGGPYDVVRYNIYRSTTGGAPWTLVTSASAGTSTYADNLSDLAPAARLETITYSYMIRADDDVNESADSNVADAMVVDNDSPASVNSVTATLVCATNTVTITWSAPTTNDDGEALPDLTGFNLYRNAGSTVFNPLNFVVSDSAAVLTYDDTTTMSGTTYTYFIEAFDDYDATVGGPNKSTVIAASSVDIVNNCTPDPVTDLDVVDTPLDEGGSLTLSWSKSPSDDGTIVGLTYDVFRRTMVPLIPFALVTSIPATQAASYSFADNNAGVGLTDGLSHEYKIVVQGTLPSPDSNFDNDASLDNIGPAAPVLNSVNLACPDILVSWTAPTLNSLGAPLTDLNGFYLYRNSGSGTSLIATLGSGVTSYTDDPTAAYPTEDLTYSYTVVAFDDASPPAADNNASVSSSTLSVYKQCVEQPNTPTLTQSCQVAPAPSTTTLTWTSGPNTVGANIVTYTIQSSESSTGPFVNTTPATTLYLGPNMVHTVNVDYPGSDGTYYYRILANADFGGGVTLDSTPSSTVSGTLTCFSFTEEPPDPSDPPDCGNNGNPWYVATDPNLMQQPYDGTIANDGGTYKVYVNDSQKQEVLIFDSQCLAPATPSTMFPAVTYKLAGTTGMVRTAKNSFAAGGATEDIFVTRTVSTTGSLYRCTPAGVCTLDLTATGRRIRSVALSPGPAPTHLYVTSDTAVYKYPYSGTTTRGSVATRNVNSPFGIDVDNAGSVYVSSITDDRIYVLDANLSATPLRTIGSFGTGNGQFKDPYGIHVMKTQGKDRIFVADRGNNRVQILDSITGAFITKFGTYGQCMPGTGCATGILNAPSGVHVNEDADLPGRLNYVLVADTLNKRAQYYVPPAAGF